VNGFEAARPRAFDVLGEVVKEQDAPGRQAYRFHHMIIGRGVRLAKSDRGGEKDFAEMAKHIGVKHREIFDMGVVGVGEHVERQAFGRARQQRRDAGHFADEDRVPPFEELGV